jgi:hypothetical protein
MARKKRFLIDMKKFIFLFLGFSSLFFSCSSDSDSQLFDSTISIDGVVFVPKQITAYPIVQWRNQQYLFSKKCKYTN